MLGAQPSANLSAGSAEAQSFSPAGRPRVSFQPPRVARAREEVTVPGAAALDRAPLGRVVDVDDAEALGVAAAPLEVVQQRPREVAADVDAVLDRPHDGF